MKFNTKTIHGGQIKEKGYGAVMPPIYQTSTYSQTKPGEHQGYEYSRTHNPTRTALENSLASIENGNFGLAFSSGLSAIDAILKLFEPGDEIISTNDLYGGSYRLFDKVFKKFGLKFIFSDLQNTEKIKDLISDRTKMIWVETPTNPMMNLIDINSISRLCKKNEILLAVDNTFATPYLQKPLDLGADIVMHSATKYLAGHSDVILGALIVKDDILAEQLYFLQNSSGAICGPMDSFLTLRGIKTLHVRMERHCQNALALAKYLNGHESVKWVNYAALPNDKYHDVCKKITNGQASGIISFGIKGGKDSGAKFIDALQMILRVLSMGDAKSLACHPASTLHRQLTPEQKALAGVSEDLIRISVGIEHIDDIISDVEQAIQASKK